MEFGLDQSDPLNSPNCKASSHMKVACEQPYKKGKKIEHKRKEKCRKSLEMSQPTTRKRLRICYACKNITTSIHFTGQIQSFFVFTCANEGGQIRKKSYFPFPLKCFFINYGRLINAFLCWMSLATMQILLRGKLLSLRVEVR